MNSPHESYSNLMFIKVDTGLSYYVQFYGISINSYIIQNGLIANNMFNVIFEEKIESLIFKYHITNIVNY